MDQRELVSPELALVDSALAARARADLPWRPWEAHAATEIVPLPGPPAPPSRRLVSPAFGVGAVLGVTVLTLSVLPTRDPPTLAAFTRPKPPPLVTPKAPAPQPPPAQVKPAAKKRVVPPPPPAQKVRAKPAPKREAAPKPAPKPDPVPPPAPPAPPPKRTYAWKPYSGAVYYQVSFVRNGARIFQTQTRTPRLRLPTRIQLGPGRYSWTVRPAIVADLGIRLADPIVRRAFRVRGD
jgi:hypothetical protein